MVQRQLHIVLDIVFSLLQQQSAIQMHKKLLIVVVEPDSDRAKSIVDGLRQAGDHEIRVMAEQAGLARQVASLQPDVVLIDMANPSRDVLEELVVKSMNATKAKVPVTSGGCCRPTRTTVSRTGAEALPIFSIGISRPSADFPRRLRCTSGCVTTLSSQAS